MEPLGKKLQQARLAKRISLEEASRVTKIRPSRIEEIEAEDFSSFPSLAYAKGFLLIYGKFLEVDVTPYLEAFETSDRVTVDGYSYLQGDSGVPGTAPIVRRQPTKRPALFPLVIAVGILVLGLYLIKLFLDIQRIVPPDGHAPSAAAASATPGPATATSPTENIVAPHAIPVEETPPSEAAGTTPLPSAIAQPPPSPTEPEVRRAEPVHPEDLVPAETASPPKIAVTPVNRVQITPVRKTFVRVILDNDVAHPAFAGWLNPSDPPLSFRARNVKVKVLERGAVQINKNGEPLTAGDSGVTFE